MRQSAGWRRRQAGQPAHHIWTPGRTVQRSSPRLTVCLQGSSTGQRWLSWSSDGGRRVAAHGVMQRLPVAAVPSFRTSLANSLAERLHSRQCAAAPPNPRGPHPAARASACRQTCGPDPMHFSPSAAAQPETHLWQSRSQRGAPPRPAGGGAPSPSAACCSQGRATSVSAPCPSYCCNMDRLRRNISRNGGWAASRHQISLLSSA